ncbi:MAG: hypothetical protein V1745_03855 [Patescibacteria group bacterium]
MTSDTTITFIINAYGAIIAVVALFLGLLAIVWKGKSEISESIEKSLGPFRDEMRVFSDRICNHDQEIGELRGKYGQSHSPMKPNEMGTRLLEDSSFNLLYPKVKDRIFKTLDGMGTRTEYDAEKNARVALKQFENDPVMDDVKEYVVNHPEEPLELIYMVASWVIREDYWKGRKTS